VRFGAGVSERTSLAEAAEEAAAAAAGALGGEEPDLVLAFASPRYGNELGRLPDALGSAWPNALVAGCSAAAVLAEGREVEDGPGVAVWAARLPGVALRGFHVDAGSLPATGASGEAWAAAVGGATGRPAGVLLLVDPFFDALEPLLGALDRFCPGAAAVGGVASGGAAPGEQALWLDGAVHRRGAVGIALEGDVELDTLVAQGCRPVGHPMFVTHCRDHLLVELDGRPPMQVLNDLFEAATPSEQELLRTSLLLGVEMRGDQLRYGQGDFLMRNLLGGDPDSGALSVATQLEPTQVVQFHVRDGGTAALDLDARLAAWAEESVAAGRGPARGGLLFSCLGRGRELYGEPHHDSRAFLRRTGPLPLAGFFANGEIGPVQGRTFVHGYTSAFAIFREPGPGR